MPAAPHSPQFPSDIPTVFPGDNPSSSTVAILTGGKDYPVYGGPDFAGSPAALTAGPLPSGEQLFADLLSQQSTGYAGYDAGAASADFQALLAQGKPSEFQQFLRENPYSARIVEEEVALSEGVPLLEVAGAALGVAALALQPGSLTASDAPPVGGIANPAALGPGAGFLNPTLDLGNNPQASDPNPWGDLKPETAHPPAPLSQTVPTFNPQLWAQPLPGPNPVKNPLTAIRTSLAPFNHLSGPTLGFGPGNAPKALPKPLPRTKAGRQGGATIIPKDCNSSNKPGQCRQGYFREQSNGSLQFITWSTRRCP